MIVGNKNTALHERPAKIEFGIRIIIRVLFVLALAMLLPVAPPMASERAPLALTGPADVETLSRHLEYIIDTDWQLKVSDFTGPSSVEMKPVLGPVPDFGYTSGKVWLRVRLVNNTDSVKDWRFLVRVAFTQQIAIYKIGSDGAVLTLANLKEDSPFSARPIPYPQVAVPFDLAPGESATLIVSYFAEGASRHAISVETTDSLMQEARTNTAKSFAFYGMMLVMIALAAVALVTLRQVVFAAYAGYFLSIFLYIAYVDGMAFQYIWPTFPLFNSIAALVTGSGVIVFGALFAISFLQTARFHPVMHRVLLALILSVLALDAIFWTTNPQMLNRLLVYMILAGVLTFVAAGLVAARTRFREVRFYMLAWMANLIPASLFTAWVAFGIKPAAITPYDVIRISLVFDSLLMGLAIFDRYNQLRQAAADETLAHAQRTMALTQRLAALEVSYDRATASARQREESVKDTVHDLRQPMHALRLSLRQLVNAESKTSSDIGHIESALGYMESLVEGQLAEQKTTADSGSDAPDMQGSRKAQVEPRLHEVLRGVADMFEMEARNKGLEIKLVMASPDAEVAAFPLMRVVANLVSNAIKYTHEGQVLISLRRQGNGHLVEVHDTGPGLKGATFTKALQRNERLERDRATVEGSGLGLAVVKETVDANGWQISSCAGRKTGATVRIHLPAV